MVTGPIRTVAVVGAGPLAVAFVERCLAAGVRVFLEDVLPANLRSASAALAPVLSAAHTGSLQTVHTVEDALREADLALDFVPDELESKLEIVSMADRMAPPRTIFCTPTEQLSITDLASCTYRPERCFALHGLPAALTSREGTSRISPAGNAQLDSAGGPPLRLSYPPASDRSVREALEHFLLALGLPVTSHLDIAETQLTRPR